MANVIKTITDGTDNILPRTTSTAITDQNGQPLNDALTKLSGIEAGADVTDAANVESAGAIMKTAQVLTTAEKQQVKQNLSIIKTAMDSVAVADAQYFLGEQSAVSITLPSTALAGQTIQVVFYSSGAGTNITITSEVIGEFPSTVTNNRRCKFKFDYDGLRWAASCEIIIVSKSRTGGQIFYIDSTAIGATYTFYDSAGNIIPEEDVVVGSIPYYYTVEGVSNKDKYYVLNNNLMTQRKWTYNNGSEWVFTSLGTSASIGTGKTNTTTVMAADSGAYVVSGTIWYQIKLLNDSEDGGCSDWFVPSQGETEALRTAVDGDGNAIVNWFTNNKIWTSSELNSRYASFWVSDWGAWSGLGTWEGKLSDYAVFGIRSF